MKNQISLRKFVETFPVESFCKVRTNIPENFKDLPYLEKYELYECRNNIPFERRKVLSVKDGHIYYGEYNRGLERKGKRIYLSRSQLSSCIWIDSNSIRFGGADKYAIALEFLLLCGKFDWHVDIPSRVKQMFFIKPSVFRAILTNKIYNEETFYKFIGSRVFGIKNIGWRSIRTFCTENIPISIFDLRDFTKNIEDSIEVLSKTTNTHLYYDLLHYAVKLDQIVDFTWSEKRINEEHQKQIEISLQKEIASKEQVPIYKNVISGDNIRMLNTELEVFMEAQNMHHCLYSCYYNQIKEHTYIAFHMSYPEDCTFSVSKQSDGKIKFDQIYLKYDRHVQSNTRAIAEKFINSHLVDIIACFNERVSKPVEKLYGLDDIFGPTIPEGNDLPY
jgi:hypothetical protein